MMISGNTTLNKMGDYDFRKVAEVDTDMDGETVKHLHG